MFCPHAHSRSSTSVRVNETSHSGSCAVTMTSQTSVLTRGSAFGAEDHDGKRGEREAERPGTAVDHLGDGVEAPAVADAAASVIPGVAVQELLPPAALGHADLVLLPGDGGE